METFWQPRNTNANGTMYIYMVGVCINMYMHIWGARAGKAPLQNLEKPGEFNNSSGRAKGEGLSNDLLENKQQQ